MSDNPQDKPLQADVPEADRVLTESAYAELRKLNEYTLHGVRVVKRSNLGPMTVHSTGSSEASPLPDSRNSPEVEKEIVEKYLDSLKAGVEKAVREQAEGKWGVKKKE